MSVKWKNDGMERNPIRSAIATQRKGRLANDYGREGTRGPTDCPGDPLEPIEHLEHLEPLEPIEPRKKVKKAKAKAKKGGS